jgi:hypothetical protein
VEQVGDRIVDGDKSLNVPGGFEALHDPLPSPCRLMGIFAAIVQSLVLAMLHAGNDPALSGAAGSKLVGHHNARSTLFAQKLPQKPFRCRSVTATLHESVENEAVLIDGSPQSVLLAGDGDRDFVKMPCVAELRRMSTNAAGEVPPKFLSPVADDLVADYDSSRR